MATQTNHRVTEMTNTTKRISPITDRKHVALRSFIGGLTPLDLTELTDDLNGLADIAGATPLKKLFDKETKAGHLTAEQIADRKYALACIENNEKTRQAGIDRDIADARIRANVNRHFSK